MENASKALLMAASILIGLIVLSLGVYLVNTFKSFSQDYNDSMEIQRMEQFNAQFTAFSTRSNVSIHEIMTLANYAKEFNSTNNIEPTNNQYIKVHIKFNEKGKQFNLTNESTYPNNGEYYKNPNKFISALLDGTYVYELYGNGRELEPFTNVEDENKGQYQYDYDETTKKKVYYNCYKCIGYEVNSQTGRVESITFEFKKIYTEQNNNKI